MQLLTNFKFFNDLLKVDQLTLSIRLMLLLSVNTLCKTAQEYYELGEWSFLMLLLISWGVLFILVYVKNIIGSHWSHWGIIAIISTVYLVYKWPRPGNHLYAYIYITLILLITLLNHPKNQITLLKANTKYLFTLIMLMAVIQKVITPGYIDGTINAFWLVTGGYFKPLYYFSDDWSAIVNSNYDLLNVYYNETYTRVDEIVLASPMANLQVWSIILSLAILLGELVVTLIFFQNRFQIVRHVAVIFLMAFIFITRQETGFLSIICILGIANCLNANKHFIKLYGVLFCLMQLIYLLDYGYA